MRVNIAMINSSEHTTNSTRHHAIYFLGFGFRPDNVRRFRFFLPENLKGKELMATAVQKPMELNALKASLSGMGFPDDAFHSYECGQFFRFKAGLN